MNQTLVTILIAFGLIFLCSVLLGIGKLITGKSKLRMGMCGRIPSEKKDKDSSCGKEHSCGLCGKTDLKEDKKE